MVTPVKLTAEAEEDWQHAVEWYEVSKEGLGRDFSAELERVITNVSLNPQCGSFLLKRLGIRRVHLRRFPYKVIYHVVGGTVEVIAIFAERQHPRVWQRRMGTGEE